MLLALLMSLSLTVAPSPTLTLSAALLTIDQKTLWMDSLSDCESLGSTTIKVLDTNDYYSYGKYQYQMATWLKYGFLGTTKYNIYDGDLQDRITRYILDNNGEDNWVICGNRVTKSLGPYPE